MSHICWPCLPSRWVCSWSYLKKWGHYVRVNEVWPTGWQAFPQTFHDWGGERLLIISLWWLVFVLFELYATPGNGFMFCFCHRENQIDSQEHIHHFYWEEEESFECGYLDHYSYRQKTSWSCWVLPELINFKWK